MFEIFAYQNSESLFGIFNAVAALMGSPTYASAIAAVAFCGFVAAALAYAFAPEKLQGWKWIATVVLVYSVLFVPRVDVISGVGYDSAAAFSTAFKQCFGLSPSSYLSA